MSRLCYVCVYCQHAIKVTLPARCPSCGCWLTYTTDVHPHTTLQQVVRRAWDNDREAALAFRPMTTNLGQELLAAADHTLAQLRGNLLWATAIVDNWTVERLFDAAFDEKITIDIKMVPRRDDDEG